jgi:hypothetical protein
LPVAELIKIPQTVPAGILGVAVGGSGVGVAVGGTDVGVAVGGTDVGGIGVDVGVAVEASDLEAAVRPAGMDVAFVSPHAANSRVTMVKPIIAISIF